MITIADKKDCCGCGACMNICPKGSIAMQPDHEGFLYPRVDESTCIGCGLCEKVCPVLHVKKDEPMQQAAYIVQIKDETVRRESTAGGAFTAIAEHVLRQGGVVYGVAYDSEFHVGHTSAETAGELFRFRNSKYVQSDTKNTFREAEAHLKAGRMVCYSGTPCQIEGLRQYLRKDYENLITVDVVCHAVPSPLIWEKYLEMQRERLGDGFTNVLFRDKHYGYKYSTMTIKGQDGKNVYNYGIDTDPMLRAFFSDICDRPSCYECAFKKRYRVCDFTIWDCYSVGNFDKKLDDDKGTTRVLIHSEKGRDLFEQIKPQLRYTEVTPDQLTAGVREMFHSVSGNEKREQFFRDANSKSGEALFGQYFPETMKVRLERTVRIVCYKTGIYSAAKRVFKAITGR
ncbi:MAG: Coenzyme F420 hydrogenase/dehydrogenase, beta subunit C-terminal domain [Ruminococcus sp.]|nr:Coenzyme F420 hydrogenase/dehydrogenase, beta subunit C-terminal domain [Ruminococcus sp.]